MAESASIAPLVIEISDEPDSPRHSALVRITHWILTLSFFGLVVSGFAIILAHPHSYWGRNRQHWDSLSFRSSTSSPESGYSWFAGI